MKGLENLYELVPLQHSILLYSLLNDDPGTYVEQFQCRIDGPLDVEAFRLAWQDATDEFDSLRASCHWKELSKPLVAVHDSVELVLRREDWRDMSTAEQRRHLEEFLEQDRESGFDISRPPLHRIALFRTSDHVHEMVWTRHHLFIDRWSRSVVLRFVLSAYGARAQGREPLKATHPSFSSYVGWLQKQNREEAKRYWERALAGVDEPTLVRRGNRSGQPVEVIRSTASCRRFLDRQDTQRVVTWAARSGVTVNTAVNAAWALLLGWYADSDDVVFGATVSLRPGELPDTENIVGLTINTLPVRVRLGKHASTEWLTALQKELALMRQNGHVSLADVRSWCGIANDLPLFDSLLVVENLPAGAAETVEECPITLRDFRSVTSGGNVPLTVVLSPGERISAEFIYDRDKYQGGFIEKLSENFLQVLGNLADEESEGGGSNIIDSIAMREPAPASVRVEYPRDASIQALFEEHARNSANNTAVKDAGGSVSYADLDRWGDSLAHRLCTAGVPQSRVVGVCVGRTRAYPAALLGVLKAGAAYLPLSVNDPAERLRFMLRDSGAELIVCDRSTRARLEEVSSDVRLVEVFDESSPPGDTHRGGGPSVCGDDIAYLMYTSGSTGKPKAVAVTHRGVVRLVRGADYISFSASETFAQIATVTFDAATFELWGALLNGAECAIFSQEVPQPGHLKSFIREHGITTALFTTSLFNVMLDEDETVFEPLRQLLIGGEALSVPHVRKFRALYPGMRLVNAYGPTEGAVITCCYQIPAGFDSEARSVPIGRPIANTSVYVLGRGGRPRPPGAPGELYIGGDGVAAGYWRRPELTEEAFVPDPFRGERDATMYRTGDEVRRLPDGNLEYLGRLDDQLKIRGHRIEPGEIENVLRTIAGVSNAHVQYVVPDGGTGRLVALVESGQDAAGFDWDGARRTLEESLPGYMIPRRLLLVERLPLTDSGKIDRRAVERLAASDTADDEHSTEPRDEVEAGLARIWADVLGKDSVGVHDNFFDLGGHSLLSIQLMGEVGRRFGRDVSLLKFFEQPTIAHLATLISSDARGQSASRVVLPIRDSGSRTPFFFVPGGAGEEIEIFEKYKQFAPYLGEERPFYGLSLESLDESEFTSIEHLASRLNQNLKAARPQGPCIIGGACVGGVLAYEMARQLAAEDYPVDLVLLLDAHCPSDDEKEHFRKLYRARFRKRLRRTIRHLYWRLRHFAAAVPRIGLRELPRYVLEKIGFAKKSLSDINSYYTRVERQAELAQNLYRPLSYEGRVLLVVPEETTERNRMLGWDRLNLKHLEVTPVPGRHGDYVKQHLPAMGRLMRTALDSTDSARGDPATQSSGVELKPEVARVGT